MKEKEKIASEDLQQALRQFVKHLEELAGMDAVAATFFISFIDYDNEELFGLCVSSGPKAVRDVASSLSVAWQEVVKLFVTSAKNLGKEPTEFLFD